MIITDGMWAVLRQKFRYLTESNSEADAFDAFIRLIFKKTVTTKNNEEERHGSTGK